MIADLVKDLRSDSISNAMAEYDISQDEATYLVDNFPNESTWKDVMNTANSLGVGITDIEEDDVESYLEMGGNKGELESSVGLIQWIYDNKLKSYLILMMLKDTPVMYKIDRELMSTWTNSDSMGEYYNSFIRGNTTIEDPEHSCGCGPNPCEPQQVDRFNTRFVSIS